MDNAAASWTELLRQAVTVPGIISDAYGKFHGYSIGNQLLAMWQCRARDIQPGPIASFMHWKSLGRSVKKGEKAIALWMPITGKRSEEIDGEKTEIPFTRFVLRNHWFVLTQTDGAEFVPEPLPAWNESDALKALAIEKVPFAHMDGNCQGFAQKRQVAVSPLAVMPFKTLFHELAHVILGHTEESELNDSERTPKNLREIEAESVALICCESLGLPGSEFSRGYIQSYGNEIPERSAQRIFSAANKILSAGTKGGAA